MSEDDRREMFWCFICKRPVNGVPKYLRPSLLSLAQLSFKEMQARHPLCTRCYKTVERLYDTILKERASSSTLTKGSGDSIDKIVHSNPLINRGTNIRSFTQDSRKTNESNPVSRNTPSSSSSWRGSHIVASDSSSSSKQSTNKVNNSPPGGSGLQPNANGKAYKQYRTKLSCFSFPRTQSANCSNEQRCHGYVFRRN